ncbi:MULTISPECIES: exodeoxyribonuclease V subunit gamma [unclassified Acinetobacter]|uniref:exodeoxyribonuclease V subunit gamma n=1 Tax=unclassified Acinetobacter TaxID=196816 RepID=UPI00190AC709|nr:MULTISPECIES: exodeoxyribonuclease V subunit gamma [unclassified Acinetobacter]MBK0062801.1 exodeoxyribonuclease V subunit gamma [Acinetobacter sp. S55]MBK0065622.1 exodeoxyribonuclease V subunit gamma [Acinetobacter sp. S54]
MAIHVIQSQRIEVLLQGLAQTSQYSHEQPFQVLATQHFIVPNAATQQWLIEKLSELQGIHANYQFHQRIRGFQWYAYQQVLSEHKDQVRKANIPRLILKWRIYQALHPYIQSEQIQVAVEHPLHSIIARIYNSADRLSKNIEKQLKKQSMLYWIAEQVSQLFSNYMLYRGHCQKNCVGECRCSNNWLSAWGENRALDIEKLILNQDQAVSLFQLKQAEELEAWQRWLWIEHFHQDFLEIEKIDELFWQQFATEHTQIHALKRLPQQVVLFTLLDLPPSQLQFLRRLGQYLDVYIFHYNPSQEYWADSVDPLWKQRYDVGVKERFIAKNPKASDVEIADFFQQFTLHFNAEARESRHPLLTRLGKQARDHFSLLSNLSTGEEGHWVDAFVDAFPATLLGHVQSDILNLVEPKAGQYLIDANDESIQIHVCHSGLRQLEVLRDQLIYWLAQGTAEQPRRPSDILVLTPNLKALEPLIRSVFPTTASDDHVFLPVKIAGIAQLDVLNAWRAVLGRIQLLQGRFNYDEFADWLSLNATQLCYGLDDSQVSRLLELLAAAGFKRGFDTAHLQQSLAPDDQDYRYSFKFALDRLALGIAIPDHVLFEGVLSYAQVQPDDFELIGKLIQIYAHFDQRRYWLVAHEQGEQLAVEAWLKRLMTDITEFEQAGVTALKPAREAIKKQERMVTLASFYGEAETQHLRQIALPLPYLIEEIQLTLENQTAQAEPTGQITFSQIGQIRPLPYRLIVLMNLDQGQFPNRDSHTPFDLMDVLRPQLGDRSRLEDDQGAFLDAVLLAQDNLWLFYNGFDVNDGEIREPSSIVQELKAHLAYIVKSEVELEEREGSKRTQLEQLSIPPHLASLYRIHSLQPFDVSGFTQQPALQRYQDHWYQVAQHIQQPQGQRQPWVNIDYQPQSQELLLLDSQQWIADVTFPARLYLKTLGVENLTEHRLLDQDEPLFLDGLGRYSIREFLHQHPVDAPADLLLDQLPVSKIKYSAWQQSVFEQECLQERLQQYAMSETPTTYRTWRLSSQLHMNIQIPAENVQDWVSLQASSARAKRIAKVWLEYLIWLAYLNQGRHEQDKRRIVVFSDQTVICEGLKPSQAQEYLNAWLVAWQYASQQPLVLPAALLLQPLEKGKQYHWEESETATSLVEKDRESILKAWNQTGAFSAIDVTQDESSKFHQDWSFILQQQDAQALLNVALTKFSHDLYAPIFQYVRTE